MEKNPIILHILSFLYNRSLDYTTYFVLDFQKGFYSSKPMIFWERSISQPDGDYHFQTWNIDYHANVI